MLERRQRWIGPVAALALAALMLATPARVAARVHVFVGGRFGVPIVVRYPGYYGPYSYYPPPQYYYPTESVPPPGFVPGRWEWGTDRYGGRIRVWVPAHLD
jgi:hypothetical protein